MNKIYPHKGDKQTVYLTLLLKTRPLLSAIIPSIMTLFPTRYISRKIMYYTIIRLIESGL